MADDLIPTRAVFPVYLRDAIAQTQDLKRQVPGFDVLTIIERQLDFMRTATSGGRVPPESERMKTDIGPIAVRNLEESYPDYARLLQELDYAFRRFDQLP
jgi:hypothetical protein